MTNKYHFTTTEEWAVGTLHTVLHPLFSIHRCFHLLSCKAQLLRRIIEVADVCSHAALRDLAVDAWICRVKARTLSPLSAMDTADEFGLTGLMGWAYYVALCDCGWRLECPDKWPADDSIPSGYISSDDHITPTENEDNTPPGTFIYRSSASSASHHLTRRRSRSQSPSPPHFLPHQKARLLSGFFSLTHFWERLRAPSFEKPPGCTYHTHGCLATWRTVWTGAMRSEVTLAVPAPDVLRRLECVMSELERDADLYSALTPACRRAALQSARAMVGNVEQGLADHFRDMTREE